MRALLNSLRRPSGWTLFGVLLAAFLLGNIFNGYHLRLPFGANGGAQVERPLPAEFLYLDNERVGAYIAQLTGGIAKSERLTETLTEEDNAKVSGNFFEVGASSQHQNFAERQVTPTAAAYYFRLLAILLQQDRLTDVSVENFDDFESLHDTGDFVRFHSRDVRTPIYANSYLVVRQAGTLKALFPTAGLDELEREETLTRRENAKSYARQVGPNPRIVFALTPKPETEIPKRSTRCQSKVAPSREETEARACKDDSVKFLMPVRYRQITDERSLIKDGGGSFTVVGKVVRLFPNGHRGRASAYVDSPTRETWEKPLEHVPGILLRYSSHKCANREADQGDEEENPLSTCVRSRLKEQTEIPDRGAVILPIAIYK